MSKADPQEKKRPAGHAAGGADEHRAMLLAPLAMLEGRSVASVAADSSPRARRTGAPEAVAAAVEALLAKAAEFDRTTGRRA